MPDVVLALDVASRTGIASGVPGRAPSLSFIDFGGREHDDSADVFARAQRWITRTFAEDLPVAIAIERPVPIHDSMLLFGLRGVVMANARVAGVPILEASIGEWRKYFLGNGGLKGPIAKRECVRLCGHLGWKVPQRSARDLEPDHNAAEAAGIWLWACAQRAPQLVQRHEPLFVTGRPA